MIDLIILSESIFLDAVFSHEPILRSASVLAATSHAYLISHGPDGFGSISPLSFPLSHPSKSIYHVICEQPAFFSHYTTAVHIELGHGPGPALNLDHHEYLVALHSQGISRRHRLFRDDQRCRSGFVPPDASVFTVSKRLIVIGT
jgi:hypothetical protein